MPFFRHWFLILVGATATATGADSSSGGTREVMADAMVRMMDAMGLFKDSGGSYNRSGGEGTRRRWTNHSSQLGGWSGWPGTQSFPMSGLTPWSSPWMGMGGLPGLSSPWDTRGWTGQFPGWWQGGYPPSQMPWGSVSPWWDGSEQSPLEGAWESPTGELLLIEGPRYRMYAGESRHLDGQLRIEGDRLLLSNPEQRSAQRFEFITQEGRLMLRDDNGQIYLYRRIFNTHPPVDDWR